MINILVCITTTHHIGRQSVCLSQLQNLHVCEIALTPDYILYIFDRKNE